MSTTNLSDWTQHNPVSMTILKLMRHDTVSDDLIDRIDLEDNRLWKHCEANEVTSIIAHQLLHKISKADIPHKWQHSHDVIHERITLYLEQLDTVATALANENIPLIALKNGGIARGIYPYPACCPMGDIDVLVSKKDFRNAHDILVSLGFHFEFRSPLEDDDLDEAEKDGSAEYWIHLDSGEKMWFELQWRPISGRWIRPDQEPNADDLIARSIPIDGTEVRLLSPEDNLLQVCVHTAKHSFVRAPGFRLHTDVDRIVRFQNIDWNIFIERVSKMRVQTATYFSLLIPKRIFGTPIPDYVLNSLKPPTWKATFLTRWIQRAGLFNPNQKKFSKVGYIIFTALLYDTWSGLWRAIFPDSAWMRQRYEIQHRYMTPFYHVKRIVDLLFRRVNT